MHQRHFYMRQLLLAGVALWPATVLAQDDPYAFFEAQVRPVLVEHCYECHASALDKPKGGLRLDLRDGLLQGGKSGSPAIVPGNAEASPLIHALRYSDPALQMPPKAKLPDAQIDAIAAWINAGAPDPRDAPPATTPQAAPARDHWAYAAPVAHTPPPVQDTAWPLNEVDLFVLARLEAAGLRPAPQADRATLIRRAYHDLLGLPSTAEAVQRFVQDPAPDAFARLVDELLASPHYGERWARRWLDVARYADTKGYVYPEREESRFFHSHVYRDWVIQALNDDMPYDAFLRYQIAGDQIRGPHGEDHRAAMGFLTLGRRFLGVVHDIIDDRIDVVTRGTLGMTMACARCHDHKFDPVSAADYYALYGVFAGSSERTVAVPGQPAQAEELAAFQQEWAKRQLDFNAEFAARKEELAARLRTQTDRYLDAALRASTFPNDAFYEIRGPDDLNPTIVWQWRRYLDRQPQDDPVWGPWRQLEALPARDFAVAAPGLCASLSPTRYNPLVVAALQWPPPQNMADVAARYGALLLGTLSQWQDTLARAEATCSADPNGFRDPAREALRRVLIDTGSPVDAPKGPMVDVEWYFDEPTRIALTRRSKAIETLLLTAPGATPHTVVLEDKPDQVTPRVFRRGNPANKGDEVPRRFPEILGGRDNAPFAQGSGRVELAEAIATPTNPLTARVMVNRVWQWHFGEGIVRTTSDFGTRCDPPSHPELLDTLAVRFVEQGWRLKDLHRLLLNSATWQQGGVPSPHNATDAATLDPDNRLLWHFAPQRLDFESLRDAVLAVSGTLAPEIGGKPVDLFSEPFTGRRTLYGTIDRTFLQGAYRVFDFPTPDMHGPRRSETTVPQQALFLMNSPFLREQARALSQSVAELPEGPARVEALYRRVLQRDPDARDTTRALDFLAASPRPTAEELAPPEPSPWHYGYGHFDAATQRVAGFEALPHFSGEAYQGGTAYPDGALGWVQLTANGGHPGNDLQHACVRRWIAPRDGEIQIAGTLRHEPAAGDGIRARIVSSVRGPLGEWRVHMGSAETALGQIAVANGEAIDFVVDIAETLNNDQFLWAPVVTFGPMASGAGAPATRAYDAAQDFAAPVELRPVPLGPWEQYAQVLLLSNAFAFVD